MSEYDKFDDEEEEYGRDEDKTQREIEKFMDEECTLVFDVRVGVPVNNEEFDTRSYIKMYEFDDDENEELFLKISTTDYFSYGYLPEGSISSYKENYFEDDMESLIPNFKFATEMKGYIEKEAFEIVTAKEETYYRLGKSLKRALFNTSD